MPDPGFLSVAESLGSFSSLIFFIFLGATLLILWQVAILLGALIASLWREGEREGETHVGVG
jgi:hypothetical protein